MSNTWEYRFAFEASQAVDIPPEFREKFDQLVRSNGQPVFGLFTPAVEESGWIHSGWIPPRVIWLFRDSIVVVSLDTRSDQVSVNEWRREDLLGYGMAEFLLHGWFSLYPNDSPGEKFVIRFPPQAARHFDELGTVLTRWRLEGETRTDISTHEPIALPGIPHKFSAFLHDHLERIAFQAFFFQPGMELRGKGEWRWGNLLFLANPESIVALSDRYRSEPSAYGVEMTVLPLRKLGSFCLHEAPDGQAASIQLTLNGSHSRLVLSWQIFDGLKPYAFRFQEGVHTLLGRAICARPARENEEMPGTGVIAANEILTDSFGNGTDRKGS